MTIKRARSCWGKQKYLHQRLLAWGGESQAKEAMTILSRVAVHGKEGADAVPYIGVRRMGEGAPCPSSLAPREEAAGRGEGLYTEARLSPRGEESRGSDFSDVVT